MSNNLIVFQKYQLLKKLLQKFTKVSVAFSGGVDSSLLLFAAAATHNREDVIAIHGSSLLQKDVSEAEKFYQRQFKKNVCLNVIKLNPLGWPDFVNNDEKRCYYCKKKSYSEFLTYLKTQGDFVLLDGTNVDDLSDDRPGLTVIKELGIATPLVEVGLKKEEIRFLARSFGLLNHDKPSDSCLATRLSKKETISTERLNLVIKIEEILNKRGFLGSRARIKQETVMIEIRQKDFSKFTQRHNRLHILSECQVLGFKKVYLEISGRL